MEKGGGGTGKSFPGVVHRAAAKQKGFRKGGGGAAVQVACRTKQCGTWEAIWVRRNQFSAGQSGKGPPKIAWRNGGGEDGSCRSTDEDIVVVTSRAIGGSPLARSGERSPPFFLPPQQKGSVVRGKEANKVHFSSYVRESFVSSREKVKFTFPGEQKRKRKEDDIGNRDPPFVPQSLLPFSAGGGGRGRISQIVVGIKKGGARQGGGKGQKAQLWRLFLRQKS